MFKATNAIWIGDCTETDSARIKESIHSFLNNDLNFTVTETIQENDVDVPWIEFISNRFNWRTVEALKTTILRDGDVVRTIIFAQGVLINYDQLQDYITWDIETNDLKFINFIRSLTNHFPLVISDYATAILYKGKIDTTTLPEGVSFISILSYLVNLTKNIKSDIVRTDAIEYSYYIGAFVNINTNLRDDEIHILEVRTRDDRLRAIQICGKGIKFLLDREQWVISYNVLTDNLDILVLLALLRITEPKGNV